MAGPPTEKWFIPSRYPMDNLRSYNSPPRDRLKEGPPTWDEAGFDHSLCTLTFERRGYQWTGI